MKDTETREVQFAKDAADGVNTMLFNHEAFNEAMAKQHRTLQQSFTGVCLQWIHYCASPDYRTDGRNEQAQAICKTIDKAMTELEGEHWFECLPLI